MSKSVALSPAEAVVLLAPNLVRGMSAIKATLLLLLLKGVLRVEQTETTCIFRNKTIAHLRAVAAPKDPPPEIAALLDIVRLAQADGGKIKDVVDRAVKAFGPACMAFTGKFITPALIARGLLVEKKFLFIRTFRATATGSAEQDRLKSELFKVSDMFKLPKSDPAQAAALAATLGTTILISDKLPKHFKLLAEAMRARGDGAAGDAALFVGDGGVDHGGVDHGDLHHHGLSGAFDSSSFDLGSFDFGSFDLGSFDAGMASFDSGFSDAGGGGDGGGGGHH